MEFFSAHVRPGTFRRMVPIAANGQPAVATYGHDDSGAYAAHSIQVLSIADGAVSEIAAFLEPALSESFGLPRVI